jgi:tRNA (guanine37-N1)-methyltransferase
MLTTLETIQMMFIRVLMISLMVVVQEWYLSPKPIFDCVQDIKPKWPLFLLSASGKKFDQKIARELSAGDGFSLICGRYEGMSIKELRMSFADGELSIGDFVLAGGEVAAMVIIEAVTRLLPGVMGNDESHASREF